MATLKEKYQDHLRNAKLARNFHNKMVARCKEEWSRLSVVEGGIDSNCHHFTLVLSAAYQQAKLIPYWGKSPQPASTYYLIKELHDVFGIVDQRDERGHVQFISEKLGPKNTAHTVSLLQAYIKDVKSKHSWLQRVMIFLDNTNKIVICRMSSGGRGTWHHSFLVAGHTKFMPDRLFASCSKSYIVADVFNSDELKGIYANHCTAPIVNENNIHQ